MWWKVGRKTPIRKLSTARGAQEKGGAEAGASASRLVLVAGRDPAVVKFEAAVVALFLDAAGVLGIPRSVVAIYAIYITAPKALSFADVADRLNISRGSVSQGLSVLKRIGLLRLSHVADRREHFEPDMGLRKLILGLIEQHVEGYIAEDHSRLKKLRAAIPYSDGEPRRIVEARLNSLISWCREVEAILPLLKTFLQLSCAKLA